MEYTLVLTAQEQSIAIMKVENGFLVRTDPGLFNRFLPGASPIPLQVAETPEKLAEIIIAWANAQ